MAITKLDFKLTNINVTDTTVNCINVEITPNDTAPIDSNVDYTVIVKKLTDTSLEDIIDAELSSDGKTITFGSTSLSYTDSIVVVAKKISENILSNRLIVDFYQQFNSTKATYPYFAPAPGKYHITLDYLGDFTVPEGDNNIGATIYTVDESVITSAKISVNEPSLVKISPKQIDVSLELPNAPNEANFGYEITVNNKKY